MSTPYNDNQEIRAPKHADTRSGPFASVAAANAAIDPAYRVQGLPVFIIVSGVMSEYWYRDGIADSDLVHNTGATGTPGSVWRNGAGAPSNGLGINGDYYLNNTNGDVHLKTSGTYSVVSNIKGATGSTGSTGSPGTPGTVWRNGTGAPSNGLGIDGDYYLNTTNSDVYLKTTGTYSVVVNIKGATGSTGSTGTPGVDGATWRTGSGVPSNGLGIDGDLYLRTSNGDVYKRATGTYSVIANITGPGGSQNLQQVTDNGNVTSNDLITGGSTTGDAIYILTTHKSSADERMYILTSFDGVNWTWLPSTPAYIAPGPGTLRDPSIMYYKGAFYVAYTAGVFGAVDYFKIIRSTDLINWTAHAQISTASALTGVTHTWSPKWFLDDNGDVYIYVSISNNSMTSFSPFWLKASSTLLDTYSAPAAVTGTSLPSNIIDTYVFKIATTYYIFYKNETTKYVEVLTSSSPTSGFTVLHSGDWAGWGNHLEGITVVKTSATTYRMYVDPYDGTTLWYSDSADLLTWSAKARINAPLPIANSTILRTGSIAVARNIMMAHHWYAFQQIGITGGQTIYGGIAASDNLFLHSTSHATKGRIYFGNFAAAYDESTESFGLGVTPGTKMDIQGTGSGSIGTLRIARGDAFAQYLSFQQHSSESGTYLTFKGTSAAAIAFGAHYTSGTPDRFSFLGTGGEIAMVWNNGTFENTGGIIYKRRGIADVAATIGAADYLIAYTTLTATRAVTIPAASTVPRQHFKIKDEAGTAGSNNITIVGTVEGSVNPVAVSTNYGIKGIYNDGTSWFFE